MTTVPFILPQGVSANRYGITLHAVVVPWKLARNAADYIARQSLPPQLSQGSSPPSSTCVIQGDHAGRTWAANTHCVWWVGRGGGRNI